MGADKLFLIFAWVLFIFDVPPKHTHTHKKAKVRSSQKNSQRGGITAHQFYTVCISERDL